MDANEFGNYLRSLRNAKGLTLTQLGNLIGYSNPYLSQIENGLKGIPAPELLKKLSGPLGVTYEELMVLAGHLGFVDWLINTEDEVDYNKELDEAYLKHSNIGRDLENRKPPELPFKELSLLIEMPNLTWHGQPISKWNRMRISGVLELLLSKPQEK